MGISESVLTLAGFVFAHAAWSLSDMPQGELLVPLAIVEKAEQRQLLRFEAETQEEAIALGKATLKQREGDVDAWAYAREGKINESGKYIDALSIEAKSPDMPESIIFVQRFQPYSSGEFKLLGEPLVAIGGMQLPAEDAHQYLGPLLSGVKSHSKAAAEWSSWTRP